MHRVLDVFHAKDKKFDFPLHGQRALQALRIQGRKILTDVFSELEQDPVCYIESWVSFFRNKELFKSIADSNHDMVFTPRMHINELCIRAVCVLTVEQYLLM